MNILAVWVLSFCVPQDEAKLKILVEQLGAESHKEREEAEAELIRTGIDAAFFVRSAMDKTSDAEVKTRGERILRNFRWRDLLGDAAGTQFAAAGSATERFEVLLRNADYLRGIDLADRDADALASEIIGAGDADWLNHLAKKVAEARLCVCRTVLGRALEAETEEVKVAALKAIDKLRMRSHAHKALLLMCDTSENVSTEAYSALITIAGTSQQTALTSLLDDGRPEIRARAAWLLFIIDARGQSSQIAALLKDRNAEVRQSAVLALHGLGAADHLKAIIDLLSDPNSNVRLRAVEAVAGMGTAEYSDILAPHLAAEDHDIVIAAAEGLIRWNASAHANKILAAVDRWLSLNTPSFDPRLAGIILGLVKWDQPAAVRLAVKAIRHFGSEIATVLEVFIQAGGEEACSEAAKLLDHPDPTLRVKIIELLIALRSTLHSDGVAKLLADPEETVRYAALKALIECGTSKYERQIAKLTRDPSARIRSEARRILHVPEVDPGELNDLLKKVRGTSESMVRDWIFCLERKDTVRSLALGQEIETHGELVIQALRRRIGLTVDREVQTKIGNLIAAIEERITRMRDQVRSRVQQLKRQGSERLSHEEDELLKLGVWCVPALLAAGENAADELKLWLDELLVRILARHLRELTATRIRRIVDRAREIYLAGTLDVEAFVRRELEPIGASYVHHTTNWKVDDRMETADGEEFQGFKGLGRFGGNRDSLLKHIVDSLNHGDGVIFLKQGKDETVDVVEQGSCLIFTMPNAERTKAWKSYVVVRLE